MAWSVDGKVICVVVGGWIDETKEKLEGSGSASIFAYVPTSQPVSLHYFAGSKENPSHLYLCLSYNSGHLNCSTDFTSHFHPDCYIMGFTSCGAWKFHCGVS